MLLLLIAFKRCGLFRVSGSIPTIKMRFQLSIFLGPMLLQHLLSMIRTTSFVSKHIGT